MELGEPAGDGAAMARYDGNRLVTLGVVMGIVHVLAGPDHLCALATLSVGSSWRAAMLGFRWGIGHSTGSRTLINLKLQVLFLSLLLSHRPRCCLCIFHGTAGGDRP